MLWSKSRKRSIPRLCIALSLILLLGGALPAFAGAQPFPPPAATPQEALRLAVESWGERYAGICEAARSPEDIGKVCSRFVAEQGGFRAYLIGQTFSEYTTWVFIRSVGRQWEFVRSAPLAFSASLSDVPWPCQCTTNQGSGQSAG
jgi:hypothetical protein